MKQFTLIKELSLPSIESTGYLYEHNVTKAKIIFLENKDENKVFSISFLTPPEKSNGVAHIIEHSVLNGSRKYPIKDPFIQLNKTSLNTFLNAMTSPDKTKYPVASCNLKDFHNLMDVYLDAVFYPNIYHNPKIFEQEGWHYELFDKKQPITIKGVVYNEMKGVFSTPEQRLNRSIQSALFPNHPYGEESGGAPEEIPNLTYEEFLAFHKKHYHPSNSFIFFYGDLDREDELHRLSEYLDAFEYQKPQSEIPPISVWTEPRDYLMEYPLLDEADTKNKAYFSLNYNLGDLSSEDKKLLSLLEYILLDAPGALLKEKLLEKELGEDIYGFYYGAIRDNIFSITGKNVAEERKDEFFQEVYATLEEIVKSGIDRKKVQAAINVYEFLNREADFGSMPKGIVFNFQILEYIMYGKDPFEIFDYDKSFARLREACEQNALEDAIQKYLLGNPHRCHIIMTPSLTYKEEQEKRFEQKMAQYKESLSDEELDNLIAKNNELLAYQSTPDTKEDLSKIPTLELSDISRDKQPLDYTTEFHDGVHFVFHPSNTSGIVYMRAFFETNWLTEEQLPAAALLCGYLTSVSSKNYSYSELSDEINLVTGEISTRLGVYNYKNTSDHFRIGLSIRGKAFAHNFGKKLQLIKEILSDPKFEETKRFRDLIKEAASQMQMSLVSGGHITSGTRALSYFSKSAYFDEITGGIQFYEFLNKWKNANNEELLEFGLSLKKLLTEMLQNAKLTIVLTYSKSDEERIKKEIIDFAKHYQTHEEFRSPASRSTLNESNEGFATSGDVNYVAKAMNFKRFGYSYHGSFAVANHLLNTEFLWNKVRVEGGAYGGMSSVRRSGDMVLVSYRDPNIKETYHAYEGIPEFFANHPAEKEDVKNAIIGTISNMDTPLTPSMENGKIASMYFSETTHEEEMSTRHEILDTTIEDIKNMSKVYEKVLSTDYICTVGAKKTLDENSELFQSIKEIR